MITGNMALQLAGMAGNFALRPEKIHLAPVDAPVQPDACRVTGTVIDVDYLGLFTRYIVALESGETMIVVQQNLLSSSSELTARQGQRVALQWQRDHMLTLK
jgi:ABC-type Fe3+/spermidine/putrescine transport system ATPase subunit